MSIAETIAAARAAVAKTYPSSTDLILAEAEAYGQRRLYPVTAAGDAVAALVGAKTIEPRHLSICKRLGLSVVIVPALDAIKNANAAVLFGRAEAAPDHETAQAHLEDGRAAEARAGARAMLGAMAKERNR
jgi:hypothetical protein